MSAMKRVGLLALIAASTFIPGVADARGYRGGGGTVTTQFGSANMNSPEWKQSGGDFRVYQQIMEQKQMMLQQRAIMKQQEAYLKQQKKAGKAQLSTPVATRPAPATKARKKRTARKALAPSVASQNVQKSSKTTKP